MTTLYEHSFGNEHLLDSRCTIIRYDDRITLALEQTAEDKKYFGAFKINPALWYKTHIIETYDIVRDEFSLPTLIIVLTFPRPGMIDDISPEDLFEIIYEEELTIKEPE